MIWFPLIAGSFALIVAAYFLWRTRAGWPALPPWSWHDIRKLIALVATILGAAAMTWMAWMLIDELLSMAKGLIGEFIKPGADPPAAVGGALTEVVEVLAWGLKLLLAGGLIVLLSLGFVITPRSFEFSGPGNIHSKFSGGDVPPEVEGARKVAEAADDAKEKIEAQAGAEPYAGPDLSDTPRSDAPENTPWH